MSELRALLDRLYVMLSRRYLSSSMLEPVRSWFEAGHPVSDVEVLALTAALYDFQMRVVIIKRNFKLLLKYLSSRGLEFRDLVDPSLSSDAVRFVRERNVGFFHRFDKYGLALPVIVSAACEARLSDSARQAVVGARKNPARGVEGLIGLEVARGIVARLWETRAVRDALGRSGSVAKALSLILPKPRGSSLLKRVNLFLRWLVRNEYPDLGLWGFIGRHELVVPLDISVARVCGRLMTGKPFKAGSIKSLRTIMGFLRGINPEDPVKYDFVLSRPAILGWCKKDLLQSDCDVCPLRRYCRASAGITSSRAGVRRGGEGPEHRRGKLLTLNAVRGMFAVRESRTGAELKCWREVTIDHGLRPDVYCENDIVIVGEVKVLKKVPRKASEFEGVTQLIRYFKHIAEEGLNRGRPIKAVLAYYVPKEGLQVPKEVCGVVEEMAVLALSAERSRGLSKVVTAGPQGGFTVLEICAKGLVREVCRL